MTLTTLVVINYIKMFILKGIIKQFMNFMEEAGSILIELFLIKMKL